MPHNAAPGSGRRLATLETAAVYAETSAQTIRRRITDGTLTGFRLGPRALRVDLNEIDAKLLQPLPTSRASA